MNNQSSEGIVAVDWGTSSFRIWALAPDGRIIAERRSAEGMQTALEVGFEAVLRSHLDALGPVISGLPKPLPVVLCGMVGARQGWREAPYVEIPADLDAIVGQATAIPADDLDIRILPGMARRDPSRADVMRGEETQLLGLLLDEPEISGLVCMPGTHAKWVRLRNGRVDGFTTAMTGELFAILANHSILQHTIGSHAPSGDPASQPFRAGLERGLSDPGRIAEMLFAIRARGLLYGVDGAEAADELSGVLIGAEVGGMVEDAAGAEILLVAAGKLAGLYGAAIEASGLSLRIVDADAAVRGGLLHAARHLWPTLMRGPSA